MKSLKNRLQDLESTLTPRQLILRYVAEMNSFDTLDKWLCHQYQPKILADTGKRRDALYDSIKRNVDSKESGALSRACRKASREFGYLYTLMTWPSLRLDQERYRYLYMLSYCIQSMVTQFRAIFSREKQAGLSLLLEEEKQSELLCFRERLKIVWVGLKGLEACEQQIRDRFFVGKPLFFQNERAFLERQFDIMTKLNFLLMDMRSQFSRDVEKGNLSHSKAVTSAKSFYDSLPLDEEELTMGVEAEASSLMVKARRDAEIYIYSHEDRVEDATKSFQTLWGIS